MSCVYHWLGRSKEDSVMENEQVRDQSRFQKEMRSGRMHSYPHGLTVLVVRGIESRVGVGLNMGYSMDLLVLMFIWV